jgi:PAS domain S-box-containing protein
LPDRLAEALSIQPSMPSTPATAADLPPHSIEADAADELILARHVERFSEVFEQAATGFATMTLAGRIVCANRALAALVGRDAADLVGIPYSALATSGESLRIDTACVQSQMLGAGAVSLEHGIRSAAPNTHVRATITLIHDASGQGLYLSLQVQDVTLERAIQEELRRAEELARLRCNAEDNAVFMLDRAGLIVSWNFGAQRIKGYSSDQAIGKHFRMLYPVDEQESGRPEHELEIAADVGRFEDEGWRVRRDGTRFRANVVITAIRDAAGALLGFTKLTRETDGALRPTVARSPELPRTTIEELRSATAMLRGCVDAFAEHAAELSDVDRAATFESIMSATARMRRVMEDLLQKRVSTQS